MPQRAIDAMPDGVVIADADGLVELISVEARRMLRVDGTVAPAEAASVLAHTVSTHLSFYVRPTESGAESAAAKVGEVLAAAQRRGHERAAGDSRETAGVGVAVMIRTHHGHTSADLRKLAGLPLPG